MKMVKMYYGDKAEQLKARIDTYKRLEDQTSDRRLLSHYRHCIGKALNEFAQVIGLTVRAI